MTAIMLKTVVFYEADKQIVTDSESICNGVLYSDYFTSNNRLCLTKCSQYKTRLCISSHLNFVKKPNFIIKSQYSIF